MALALPLTPAQVEYLESQLADRQQRMLEQVESLIAAAVQPLHQQLNALTQQLATLQEAVTVMDEATFKAGDLLSLKVASGWFLSVKDGGPISDNKPILFESRPNPGPWESFTTERGQP
jgi:uncharacterized membrane protein YgcG